MTHHVILIISVLSFLFSSPFFTASKNTITSVNDGLTAEQVVDSLQKLGYFRYSKPENIDLLKKEIISGLDEHAFLSTLFEENSPYNSKDYRHHPLDGEELFELGGFTGKLKEMEITFDKMKVKMVVNQHTEAWDDRKGLYHRITINNKNYIIFNNFKGYGWGEAAQRFADIVNDQLELQGSDERIYLVSAGNDGNAVFLTQDQYKLLDGVLRGETDRPLTVERWCRVMRVIRESVIE